MPLVRTPFASCIAFALFPSAALADSPTLQSAIGNPGDFKLSGSVRARYETLDGQPRAGFNRHDEQVDLRTTVLAEYRSSRLRIGAEMYDSRAYLDKTGSAVSANEVNALELVQAYVGLDLADALGTATSLQLQAGRMMLNLGSRRLVAADDYRNTTNGYTGLRADVKGRDGTTATFIYVLPQVRRPDDQASVRENRVQRDRESFDLQLWGGIVARPRTVAGASVELSYFRLREADSPGRPNRNRDLHTVGGRIMRDAKPGKFDFEAEGFYQFGAIRASLAATAPKLDVSAYFVHLDAGYSFSGPARLRVSAEYDLASGDGGGKAFGRFDTLFGMRRADLAPAGIYNAIGRTNISTPGLRVEIAPGKRFDAFAGYRAMWLAKRTDAFSTTGVRDATGRSGSFAGHQVEARMRYWLMPGFLRGEVDAVWLAKARFLETAPNTPTASDTRYFSTAVTATF